LIYSICISFEETIHKLNVIYMFFY
jgi:hypothetical protein